MVVLRRLEVEGYRLFHSPFAASFPDGLTVVAGPVGSGKSSLVSAIEYALYGTDFYVARKYYGKRDLVNAARGYLKVVLEVEAEEGEGVYKFERELSRDGRERAVVRLPSGAVVSGSRDVSAVAEELLGLDFMEFSRSISVNHVLLFLLAYGSNKTRSMIIDKLLKLNAVERFARSIALSKLKVELGRVEGELRALEGEAEAWRRRVVDLEEELRRAREELEELGRRAREYEAELEGLEPRAREYERLASQVELRREEIAKLRERAKGGVLSLEEVAVRLSRVRKEMLSVAEGLQAPLSLVKEVEGVRVDGQSAESALSSLEELVKSLQGIYNERDAALREMAADLNGRRSLLDNLRRQLVSLERDADEYERAQERLEELQSKFSDEQEVRGRLEELKRERERLERQLQGERFLSSTRRELAEAVAKKREAVCPLCLSKVGSEILDRLRKAPSVSARDLESRLQAVDGELNRLKEALNDIREAKLEIINLEERYREYQQAVEFVKELERGLEEDAEEAAVLEVSLRGVDEDLRWVRQELGRLRGELRKRSDVAELQRLEEEVKALEGRLRELESGHSKYEELKEAYGRALSLLHRKEGEVESLERSLAAGVGPSRERLLELRRRYEKLRDLVNRLERIRLCAIRVHTELREQSLEEVNRLLNTVVKDLYPYSGVEEVRLRVVPPSSEEERHSRYQLEVKVGGEWYPYSARLSDGQRAIAFLSLTLAFNRLLGGRVNSIILDEPLPNVDDAIKVNFLKFLSSKLGVKQVILTTQAEDIAASIQGLNLVKLSRP